VARSRPADLLLVPDALDQPGRLEEDPQVLLDAGHREDDAAAGQLRPQLLQRVQRREVDLDVGLGVEQEPLHRRGRGVDGGQRAGAEVLGVGEEQGRVVAVDHETGNQPRTRVVVDVVHPGDAGHVAEDGVVRPGDPAQQVGDRQTDRDQDAVEHAEHDHGDRRRQGEHQLAAAEPGEPAELAEVDQPQAGVDDEGAQRGRGERLEDRAEEQHGGDDGGQRHQGVQLAAAAQRVADDRAAGAAADREALQPAGGDVDGTEREELGVGVDG